MKKIINNNVITKSTTLGELLAIIGSVTKVVKIPFAKKLYSETGELIAIQKYQTMEVFEMKEFGNVIQHVFMTVGDQAAYFLGGYDGLLIALVVVVVVDYITSLMCDVIDKKLSRGVGLRGIYCKVLIFILVGIANILDVEVINTESILRTTVIFFYLSNEGVSLLERAAYLGLPLPTKLKGILQSMVLRHPDVLVDSFLDMFRSHIHFLQQSLPLHSQIIHAKYPVGDNLKRRVKCILFYEHLVHCNYEQILKPLVDQVQCSAFDTVEFVVALPEDEAVLVIRVPYLGAEMTVTVATHNFFVKDVSIDSLLFSRVLYLQLPLHRVRNSWQNDWGMIGIHVELMDFQIAFFLLFGEQSHSIVFLQQGCAFIFFVEE